MFFDPISIIAGLLPVATHAITRVINRFTGGPTPQSVDEVIQLQNADIQKLQALAQLDTVGDAHKWVNDLRGAMRPIISIVIIVAWFIVVCGDYPLGVTQLVCDLASAVAFYMFGDRTMMYIRKGAY